MTDATADAIAVAAAEKKAADQYGYYVLGILTLVYTFNFIDRQIIAILSPAIKEELGLSDSMMGLLKGLAFAMFYTVLGVPIAWLADRWNRVSIVAISLAVWSGFTALSGFAQNAAHLAIARLGVGVGEAGCNPPAHSLIADYFGKDKRASALAIYSLGIPFGQMFAFLAGGWVLENLGWRNAFFIVGLPGVLLAIIMKLTVREPIRGAKDAVQTDVATSASFSANVKQLFAIPSFWGVTAGVTLASFTGYGTGLWIVDFYRRTYELSYTDITVPLGLLNGIAYGVGTFLGGALTDRFGRRGKGAYAWVPAIGMLATIPAGWLSTWATTPFWAFFWSAPFLVGLGLYLGPSFSLIQTLAPLRLRAFACSLFLLIVNIVALGFGPLWVGALSDVFAVAHGEVTGLRIAITTLGASSLAAAAAFYWTSKKLPRDWEIAAKAEA